MAACLLASCGGGDGGSSPPPTGGTPTPSPTPSPTASPTYSTFAGLAQDTAFDTACLGFYRVDPSDPDRVGLTDPTFGEGLSFSYTAATQAYTIAGEGFSHSFTPADRDTRYDGVYFKYDNVGLATLSISPTAADYARRVSLISDSNGIPYQIVDCVTGVTTHAGDLPRSPVYYEPIAIGGYLAINGHTYDLSAATARARFGRSSGAGFEVRLAGKQTDGTSDSPPPDTVVSLGTIRSAAAGPYDGKGFSGNLTSPNLPNFSGAFGGSLFGPAGSEIGIIMNFRGIATDGSEYFGRVIVIGEQET